MDIVDKVRAKLTDYVPEPRIPMQRLLIMQEALEHGPASPEGKLIDAWISEWSDEYRKTWETWKRTAGWGLRPCHTLATESCSS